ncbi:hypothetical protein BGZ92_000282 [Podila epicladia]|nr:hypothetical protein BGZ92_000282 [Podila epicladia]
MDALFGHKPDISPLAAHSMTIEGDQKQHDNQQPATASPNRRLQEGDDAAQDLREIEDTADDTYSNNDLDDAYPTISDGSDANDHFDTPGAEIEMHALRGHFLVTVTMS